MQKIPEESHHGAQRRLLIVAYYFPPIGGIGSIRLARFAELLPELGWEPTVVAPRRTPHEHDPELRFPEEKVVRSHSIEPSLLARGSRARRSSAGGGAAPGERRDPALVRALRYAALRFLLYPDPQVGWYPGAVLAGRQILSHGGFAAIYSSSNPVTAHLVARTLSRRFGLPWIAEFRDPWQDGLPAGHPHRERAARLEASIAREATRVVMPTPTWAEHYGTLWQRSVDVVPNGCDSAIRAPERPYEPTIAHLGSLYPGRQDLRPLWNALGEMRRRGRAVPRIRFIGRLPAAVRSAIEEHGLEDRLEVTGFVSHQEAMRALASSSLLVASGFRPDEALTRGWVPAKLFDYLATDLPVLCVAHPATDAARLLQDQPGCHVVGPDDKDGMAAALESALSGERYRRDLERLSRYERTRQLAGILDEVVPAAEQSG